MSRYGKTHWNNRYFSETLLWGSLKIVRIANGLVSNHPNKILEEGGFSLFCHEYSLVIRCGDEDWTGGM